MADSHIEQVLCASSFFKGLARPHLQALADAAHIKLVKRKTLLFREGQTAGQIYLLVHGMVRLQKGAGGARTTVIKTVKPGEAFAEVILFETSQYPVTALAMTDAELLVVPRAAILRLLEEAAFRTNFIGMLLQKQRYLAERLQQFQHDDLETRLFQYLREQYGERQVIHTPLSKKDVAQAIGATPESLSRLLLRLRQTGRLDWRRRTITRGP